jgi:hypothetical protein
MEVNKQHQRLQKAYDFFRKAETSGQQFTLEEIRQATGWSLTTIKAYRSKKWHWFLEEKQHHFRVLNQFRDFPEENFLRIHAQRTDNDIRNLRPRFSQIVDNLIDKARESALLAVQVYNNPLTTFRTPGYLALMHIAFTGLFHAIFERRGTEYVYKNYDGTPQIIDGDTKAWELSKCVETYYGNKNLPERENLRFLSQLRNKIEHRFLPPLDLTVAGHCQAMLFNFEALLKKEFGSFFSMGNSLALALQLSEIHPSQREAINHIQKKEYDDIRKFIDIYQQELPLDIIQSPQYSFRVYLVPKIGNHAASSDLAVEFVHYDPTKPEEMEQYEKQVALIRERRVQVADQGKLLPGKVVQLIKDATGIPFNITDHTKAWKLYKVRPQLHVAEGCRAEYCQYSEAFNAFVYTQNWVDFLIKKVQDPTEYQRIKNFKG